jgi:uncharacterized membrane protein
MWHKATTTSREQHQRSQRFQSPTPTRSYINVSDIERWASVVGGGALVLGGLARRSLGGVALAALGGCLVYRGVSGHCHVFEVLGLHTGHRTHSPAASIPAGHGVRAEITLAVDRCPEHLYRFWIDFENLPTFMKHLRSVHRIDDKRSHWAADAPLGMNVEWDAEIINQRDGELVAWRSVEGSVVDTAGSVHFEKDPNGLGTIVRVNLKYDPPAGKLGATIAKVFGKGPTEMIREDLRRFKEFMEAGKVATTEGQPTGRERV